MRVQPSPVRSAAYAEALERDGSVKQLGISKQNVRVSKSARDSGAALAIPEGHLVFGRRPPHRVELSFLVKRANQRRGAATAAAEADPRGMREARSRGPGEILKPGQLRLATSGRCAALCFRRDTSRIQRAV